MDDVIVLDLETQYTASEVGGWGNIRDMQLAVGVTYHVAENAYRTYLEQEVELLIGKLREADLVVGYNLLRFDYEVLRRYTDDPLLDLPTVDMLDDIHRTLGWRLKLDDVAAATLGEGKSADGLQAVRWFRQGQLQKVIDYCRHDVEVTWRVYRFGQLNGYVKYRDRQWRIRRVPVRW
ncbi:MAG: ribonuclease H-like domain-containing protein [Anaerolineae bacterium]|jgi:DEAD/DEAH box helicase domain-containing protein